VYRRALLGGTCLLILIGLVGTPLIRTLQPAEVIDDPAMMLLVLGSLSAVATVETVRRHQRPPTPSRPREAGPARIAAGVLEHRR
jgi:hypothetical protein